jgi:hypothetical protein
MWTTKRILILGTTYPSYSSKYVENVCTGGLEEGTGRLFRIHPIPLRYLEPQHRFKKFQWVQAQVMKHPSDPRPESLRVKPDSIEPQEVIPPKMVAERKRLILSSPYMLKSVEELRDRWQRDQTSLGAIKPKEITGVRIVPRPASERKEWEDKERVLLSQQDLLERPPKPLDFPEVSFRVSWRCDDERCTGHEMGIMQWGVHELYRKHRFDPDRDTKIIARMNEDLDLAKRDVFLFLGNFRTTMWNFGLMDSFSPEKEAENPQLALF